MFTLKTISKSNTSFIYHIEVKVADETYFVEMRKHKLTSHKIYLRCTSKKCNAKINIIVKPEIPIEKVSILYNVYMESQVYRGFAKSVSYHPANYAHLKIKA